MGWRVRFAVSAMVAPLLCLGWATPAWVAERVDPEGVWNCIVFGDPVREEERINLVLTPIAATYIATQRAGDVAVWRRVGDWETRRREISFVDIRTNRIYTANLDHPTLGGSWASAGRSGGWWCARRDVDPITVQRDFGSSTPAFYVPPLVPDSMVSPRYPRQAIREAREGSAVVCFIVESDGSVRDPVIVDIDDTIFAATTLNAIGRSRYRPTTQADLARPGCRAYTYTLDMIRQ